MLRWDLRREKWSQRDRQDPARRFPVRFSFPLSAVWRRPDLSQSTLDCNFGILALGRGGSTGAVFANDAVNFRYQAVHDKMNQYDVPNVFESLSGCRARQVYDAALPLAQDT